MEKIPRYLYPVEDELPIPNYLSNIELDIEEKKTKRKSKRKRKTKNKAKTKKNRKTIY